MRPTAVHQTSRGDPLRLLLISALLIGAVPCVLPAQDAPVGGPADTVARTAARALIASDVPDDQPLPVVPIVSGGEPEGIFAEPRILMRGVDFAVRTVGDGTQTGSGFYPEFSNMPTGSGWISLGPGYRQWLNGDRLVLDASAAVSWRAYSMVQGRVELPKLASSRLAIGSQVMWQDETQVTYFGPGAASLESAQSEYRIKSTDVVGYATLRPQEWLAINGKVGWLEQPTLYEPGGTFKRGNPSALLTFATDPAVQMATQPSYLHGEASITADTRDSRSHPAHGGVYRAAWSAYSDRRNGAFSFDRYEAEAAQFVSLFADTVVLVGHGWVIGSDTASASELPFYLLPSLGGHNTLRSYTDFRFHDRNMLVANAEARLAVMTHVDIAAFVDAGNVAARFGDLDLSKRSVGVGLQMHTDRATFARVDVAHGAEGWQLLFRTDDPFHLSRLSRRIVPIPFTP